MGLPVEVNNLMMGSLGGYNINRSLRFRSSASAYLNRTLGSPSRTTNTISCWVKRGNLTSSYGPLYFATNWNSGVNFEGSGGAVPDSIQILDASNSAGSTYYVDIRTSQVFRDPSAWYHLVIVYDTTNATSSDRIRLYVNGARVTNFQTATYPSQNQQLNLFAPSEPWRIGSRGWGSVFYLDGYMAEFNYIDGQALTPSSFGAYDTNGVWQPKKYTGTYGTNGFYLPFSNTTSTTTLVADSSGNGNNWTPNNISLTAGTTYDSMIDSPTVSVTSSNYAVLNPLDKGSDATLIDGNLSMYTPTSGGSAFVVRSSIAIPRSGKWYWEGSSVSLNGNPANNAIFGVIAQSSALTSYLGSTSTGYGYYANNGNKYNNGSATAYGATYTSTDIIGVAFDADAGTLTFYKNNVSQGTAFTGLTGTTYFAAVGNGGSSASINFGQRPFSYTPPTGFNALNTYNLPAPSIANGAQYMAATTYTGNGTNGRVITTSLNEVGLAWIKLRSGIDDHRIANIVTGGNKHLKSNTTDAESTGTTIIQGFSGNTFTVGTDTSVNANGSTYVAWGWAANGTGVTNNSGTITSTVSANPTAGFSIVTYTGTGANATVGHGLGVAPSMIIFKVRSNGTYGWYCYHTSIGATNHLVLNTTAASSASSTLFNDTVPTSSVMSVGTSNGTNQSGQTYVAYCFAAVSGYSSMGSFTGNGSADGPFIFTNFRPRWVMFKNASSSPTNWFIFDTSRDTYNVAYQRLFPSTSDQEYTNANTLDFLSNGFKIRDSSAAWNGSGNTIIYAAFAESPFKISRAR
jgi:hypothetical protein